MEYCPHCLTPIKSGETGRYCPTCNGDLAWTGNQGMELPVGTILTGGDGKKSYWIGAARGRGGFGITYGAIETNSQQIVAVKEFFPTRCAHRDSNGTDVLPFTGQESIFNGGMKSFLKEAKMLGSQSDLPSVVQVLDFFENNGTAYLVMEFLNGLPLHAFMRRFPDKHIPAKLLLEKLHPVLQDLGALHKREVLHRDISPDNLMWMPNGTIKLLDFGSARSMENGKSMTVMMKEGFSPIEQYRSRGQGPYTDIYSMAATIYYCTTGSIPPGAIERLEDESLKLPGELGAQLSDTQEAALLWALSVQPQARPQSMEQFCSLLYADWNPKPEQSDGKGETGKDPEKKPEQEPEKETVVETGKEPEVHVEVPPPEPEVRKDPVKPADSGTKPEEGKGKDKVDPFEAQRQSGVQSPGHTVLVNPPQGPTAPQIQYPDYSKYVTPLVAGIVFCIVALAGLVAYLFLG